MNKNKFNINVFEKINGSAAVSSEDGDVLFNLISQALKKNLIVILDFNNIDIITSTFLNSAIGQLYSEYKGEFLKGHLKIVKMDKEDSSLLKLVVTRAKQYFENKEVMEKALKEIDKNE